MIKLDVNSKEGSINEMLTFQEYQIRVNKELDKFEEKESVFKIKVGQCLFETDNLEEFRDMCTISRNNPFLNRAMSEGEKIIIEIN